MLLRLERGGLSCGPEDVKSLHTTTLFEVPLAQSLVGASRDKGAVVQVQGGDLGNVGGKSKDFGVGQTDGTRASRDSRSHGGALWVLKEIRGFRIVVFVKVWQVGFGE